MTSRRGFLSALFVPLGVRVPPKHVPIVPEFVMPNESKIRLSFDTTTVPPGRYRSITRFLVEGPNTVYLKEIVVEPDKP